MRNCWAAKRKQDRSKCIHKFLLLVLVKQVLQWLKYFIDADFRNFRWNVPHNSKLNGKVREKALLANIDKKIFIHLSHHTFATTITICNVIYLETVSKILGHSTIKNTQEYSKITGSKVKNEMSKIMGIYILFFSVLFKIYTDINCCIKET